MFCLPIHREMDAVPTSAVMNSAALHVPGRAFVWTYA